MYVYMCVYSWMDGAPSGPVLSERSWLPSCQSFRGSRGVGFRALRLGIVDLGRV